MSSSIQIACAAQTEFGGRCRNVAVSGSRFCSQPQHNKPVGLADKTIYKFYHLSHENVDLLLSLGVPQVSYESNTKLVDMGVKMQAERCGRQAFAIRKNRADAGSQVFGKLGLRHAKTNEAFAESERTGKLVGVALQGGILVVTFAKKGDPVTIDASVLNTIREWCLTAAKIHVWSNPAGDDGLTSDTVNINPEETDDIQFSLRLNSGLWDVK